MASKAFRLGPQLKEIRIHLCQTSASSQGVRNFIHESYVPLKKANPEFPILIRECSGITPRLFARYELEIERMANSSAAKTIRFVPTFIDMQIHFCVRSHQSQGMMEFIDKFLPDIRKENPHIPVRLIHSPEIEPWIWARYKHLQHRKLDVSNMNGNQVLAAVEYLAMGCWYVHKVHDRPHWSARLKETEVRTRDPYQVFSKR